MLIYIIDFLVVSIQAYMLSNFICRYLKIKRSYFASMIISIISLEFQYFVLNYFVPNGAARLIVSFLCFTITGWILFNGNIKIRIFWGMIEWVVYVGLDFLVFLVFYPWLNLLLSEDLLISNRLLLGRCLYNVTLYLIVLCLEFVLQKKKETGNIYMLSVVLGACQICIMYTMYETNPIYLTSQAMLLSIIYSAVIILGYFIVKELFFQMIEVQRKQDELEKMMLETQFQYELYCRVLKQNEILRDLRHDWKNQLQILKYMLQDEEDEKVHNKVEQMLENMINLR